MIGWTDLPADLSDAGRIARLSALLPEAPVVSSDLRRARDTAAAIAGERPRLAPDPDLREIHFGAWENRTFAEAEAEDPDLLRAFWETPGRVAPPGGESWGALAARVTTALDRLGERHKVLIVVCHFGPILTQVERALGLSTVEAFGQRIEPLSLTRVSLGAEGWRADPINHLP